MNNTRIMKTILPALLSEMVNNHAIWLGTGGQEGMKADFSHLDLTGVNLSGADLRESTIVLAKLASVNFSGANLMMADLSQVDLAGANLSGADLSGADLMLADLTGSDLSGAEFSVADLSGANLLRARMTGASFSQANLSGADLSEADLTGGDFIGADLTGANLMSANLSGVDFSRAKLSKADLTGANLLLTTFKDTTFDQTVLSDIVIDSFTLTKIPPVSLESYQHTFRIIAPDHIGKFVISREIRFRSPFYFAGTALVSGILSFLMRRFSEERFHARMEYRGPYVRFLVDAADATTQGEIEEFLEIYGRVLLEELIPDVLSRSQEEIQIIQSQWDHARFLIAAERRQIGASSVMEDVLDMDVKRLRAQVGRLLMEGSSSPVREEERDYVGVARSQAIMHFQTFLRSMKGQPPDLSPDIDVIIEKLTTEFPDDHDISEIETALSAIKGRSPERFQEISEAFMDFGLGETPSVMTDVFLELIHRLS